MRSDTGRARLDHLLSELLPGSAEMVGHSLASMISARGTLGTMALIGLLWSGSAVFGAEHNVVRWRAPGQQRETTSGEA